MPSEFFKTSTTGVADFHCDRCPHHGFKAFGADEGVKSEMTHLLQDLYGGRAELIEVRHATEDEEGDYSRGTETTLLKTLLGLQRPLGGQVEPDGRPLHTLSATEGPASSG